MAAVALSCTSAVDAAPSTEEARVVVPEKTPRKEPVRVTRAPLVARHQTAPARRAREPMVPAYAIPSLAPLGAAQPPAPPIVAYAPAASFVSLPPTPPLAIQGTPGAPQGYSGSAATNIGRVGPISTSGTSLPSSFGPSPRP